MALYFDCRINKNAPLQTVFLAILPTKKVYVGIYILEDSISLNFTNSV